MIVKDRRIESIKKYKQSKVRKHVQCVHRKEKPFVSPSSSHFVFFALSYVSPIINKHVDTVVYHQGSCQWTMRYQSVEICS
jgi:hypothetical protein